MASAGWSRLHEPEQQETVPVKVTLWDAMRQYSILDGVKQLPHVPCARSSLLMGMATAASVGTIQIVFGRGIHRSLNWAVGSFMFISVFAWETCRRSRAAEQARMKSMMERYEKRRDQHHNKHATS